MQVNYKTISQAAKEAYDYIEARRDGTIKSLMTSWDKLNKELLDGFEYGTINLICGASGSGKTLLLNQLETGLHDLNPDQKFISINFNFEMLARTLIIRKMSASRQLTMKELLSAENGHNLSNIDLAAIKAELQGLSKYNIFYVDQPKTIPELKWIIEDFYNRFKLPMVISLDHSILVKRSSNDLNTTDMLYNLGEALNTLKKEYPVIFFIASQLNRDIEDVERNRRPSAMMFPKKSDISYADALYQYADTVIINHRPAQFNITRYGPEGWQVTNNDIFWHILKNRQGSTPILKMLANFRHMSIEEDDFFRTELNN